MIQENDVTNLIQEFWLLFHVFLCMMRDRLAWI